MVSSTSLALLFNLILVQNIVVNKRGFAFIDLPDQVALDKAIEKLSGLKINGKEISVEHSGNSLVRFNPV